MLLYLRNESLYRIDTIELIDGCYPRITYDVGTFGSDGVRSPPPTEEYCVSDLNVEPALWGIILILDRVCVDVKRRRFSWATSSFGKILDDEGNDCIIKCIYLVNLIVSSNCLPSKCKAIEVQVSCVTIFKHCK